MSYVYLCQTNKIKSTKLTKENIFSLCLENVSYVKWMLVTQWKTSISEFKLETMTAADNEYMCRVNWNTTRVKYRISSNPSDLGERERNGQPHVHTCTRAQTVLNVPLKYVDYLINISIDIGPCHLPSCFLCLHPIAYTLNAGLVTNAYSHNRMSNDV